MGLLIESIAESFTSAAELEIVKDIKQQRCFVAKKYDEEKEQAQNSSMKRCSARPPRQESHHHPGCHSHAVPRTPLQAIPQRILLQVDPRTHVAINQRLRHRHQKGPLQELDPLWRNHHVRGSSRQTEG